MGVKLKGGLREEGGLGENKYKYKDKDIKVNEKILSVIIAYSY